MRVLTDGLLKFTVEYGEGGMELKWAFDFIQNLNFFIQQLMDK